MAEILLADDDRVARTSFRNLLESEGFVVRLARNGEEAVADFRAHRPNLVLLDVMMPKKNGLAACMEIRELDGQIPIIFFTAMPSDVSLVRGLGMGADDYIAKDRSPTEFIARVRAALRRAAPKAEEARPPFIQLGTTRVDPTVMIARHESGEEHLTRSEMLALRALVDAHGAIVEYPKFYAIFGGEGYIGSENAVGKVLRRLKGKLGRGGELIVSERGVGYRLVD
ncbi:MAG: response regulator transcription factor [Kiritimatiellia bacterium]